MRDVAAADAASGLAGVAATDARGLKKKPSLRDVAAADAAGAGSGSGLAGVAAADTRGQLKKKPSLRDVAAADAGGLASLSATDVASGGDHTSRLVKKRSLRDVAAADAHSGLASVAAADAGAVGGLSALSAADTQGASAAASARLLQTLVVAQAHRRAPESASAVRVLREQLQARVATFEMLATIADSKVRRAVLCV